MEKVVEVWTTREVLRRQEKAVSIDKPVVKRRCSPFSTQQPALELYFLDVATRVSLYHSTLMTMLRRGGSNIGRGAGSCRVKMPFLLSL